VTTPPIDFDARARTWDEDAAKVDRARRVADAIAARVPLAGKTVLEYGAGTGLLGLALQSRVAQVTLVDSSREMLAVAREKIAASGVANATTLLLDLAAGPPPPGTRFDVVCSLMTLHHVPDTEGILRAFHALLAPGGVLCVADLDREDGSFHGPGVPVHHGFDRPELAARLERCGFRPVEFVTACEVARPAGASVRSYPVFLAIASKA